MHKDSIYIKISSSVRQVKIKCTTVQFSKPDKCSVDPIFQVAKFNLLTTHGQMSATIKIGPACIVYVLIIANQKLIASIREMYVFVFVAIVTFDFSSMEKGC